MQPTPLCNLDCSYCYLPNRKSKHLMPLSVARAVADGIRISNDAESPIESNIIWHGGEPLTAGIDALMHLMDCFPGTTKHSVQTNATLIDQQWVDFFESQKIHIGISIDGERSANTQRQDYSGREVYDRIVSGIEVLRGRGVPYDMIAVVSDPNPRRAEELYSFSVSLGSRSLAVNIEEREGENRRDHHFVDHAIKGFWTALWEAWQSEPAIPVREFERIRDYALIPNRDRGFPLADPFPTVSWEGKVTLHSPELSGYSSPRHGEFASGNVLDQPFHQIIATGQQSSWVHEYARGIANCRESCRIFDFCRGGHASNRHFEHGRLDGTETSYCRNSKIALFDAVGEKICARASNWPGPPGGQQAPHPKFDNRPSWDNWGKSSRKFDSSPSWDNWDKKGRK
ncbi:multiple cyclophane-containing RiPP AmcA [Frankia sp. R43]|uniref:multiple cyclophane-containing RiPP AmcA n=1 Tax=Frankia sp. R43 TaxID=269536 RepID=UPI001F19895E|nr:multiple cyclophane-containing RiPP AmcA [Frankia sp. R43]